MLLFSFSLVSKFAICGSLTDQEIVESVNNNNGDSDGDEQQEPITSNRAAIAVYKLKKYLQTQANTDDFQLSLNKIENFLDKNLFFKSSKQTKVTDLFKKM